MLVNPNVQQPAYTAQPAPVPNGVGQADVVRSDLPPIEQSPESSSGQNQQLQSDGRFQESQQKKVPLEQSQETAKQSSVNDGTGTPGTAANDTNLAAGQESVNEERLAEQQRREDAAIIQQLKARDREVRLHEAAHAAVGGRYAGAPQLKFERGPDGVSYAVSGEVSISVSKASTPEQTLEKARQIRAAATAPAEPSSQDRAVAAEASRLEAEARSDIQAQEVEQRQDRRERLDERNNEESEDERLTTETESRTPEEVSVADTVQPQESVSVAGPQSDNGEGSERAGDEAEESGDEQNARERLEEILLGNQSVPEALNQAGLVDTQNPYGKSGFIELIV